MAAPTTTPNPRIHRLLPIAAGITIVAGTFLTDLIIAGDGLMAPPQALCVAAGCALLLTPLVFRGPRLRIVLARVSLLVLTIAMVIALLELAFRAARYDFMDYGRHERAVPIYYRRPMLHAGEGLYRREGPDSWHGRPLSAFLSLQGLTPGPYADEQPVLIEYDAQGFRNPPNLSDWDIVVAGDSFVELGFLGYEDLFTTHLSRRLGLRVKNLGVSYTGPRSQEFYLRNYGVAPSAREAILCFFEGNDLLDLDRETRHSEIFRATGRTLVRRRQKQTSLLRAIQDLFPRATRSISATTMKPIPEIPGATESSRFHHNAYFVANGAERPMTVGVMPPVWDRLEDDEPAKLADALGKWAHTARAHGMRPWLVCIPDSHRAFHGYLRFIDPECELARWTPGPFAEPLGRLCRDLGIEFIDSYPALRREVEAGRAPYNLVGDTHLNAFGARVLGDLLADAIGRARSQ